MEINSVISLIMTNGIGAVCSALVVWLAWYRETRTLPTMLAAFDETQRALAKSFADRNKEMLDTFAKAVRDERDRYERWNEAHCSRLDLLAEEVRENSNALRSLVGKVVRGPTNDLP